ncbi:DUF3592 domain-containing protein [Amycolatopsis rifamycinica]|uniref:DUF3592 domain-containing protein n=1 Tax=Amycolatopsis rifamycinica TaxID=287986 RepID=A0A066U6R8_9PSEU|nr:DUF3592 domain-containing protein [Amycolatopsis rifamycinica]KDN19804.1 hypothetical protein DV20_22140 [Amycolatopsis rifamycinica]
MDLGWDAQAAARRLSRRRTAWAVTAALCVAVFVLFVIGTAVTLADPAYVFADGELAAELGTLAGSAALGALAVARSRAADRRSESVLARLSLETWLPPPERLDGGVGVDFDVETARLRTLGRRALALALLWCGVLAGGIAGLEAIENAAEGLLATGVRTGGEVVEVVNPPSGRGSPSMWVTYEAGGTVFTEEIVRDSSRAYVPGDRVTVVYDRADPEHVRTVEEPNDNQYLVGFCVVPMLLALVAVPVSLVAASRWRQRHRAVRHTGWRAAAVTVVPDYPVRKGRHTPDIHVRYRDGSVIALRAATSTHGATVLKNRPDRPAWVGGWGRDMVVLFPDAPLRKRPYAVPAYARSPRKAG